MTNNRMEYITDLVQKNKIVTVKQLSEQLHVTEKTIRLDLEKLEQAHVLIRVHGGAICNNQFSGVYPDQTYRERSSDEKKEIALKAISLIQPNDIIALDDGTTTLELAKLLGDFPITVLTNDVAIFNKLVKKPNVVLYMVGGVLKREGNSYIISGDEAVQFIKKFRVNKLFLGTSTIDEQNGLMIFHYGDRAIKRAFLSISSQVICLADSQKFDQTAFINFADIHEVNTIITNSSMDEKIANKYIKHNIQFIIADKIKHP